MRLSGCVSGSPRWSATLRAPVDASRLSEPEGRLSVCASLTRRGRTPLALASCAGSRFRETNHEFVQSNECEGLTSGSRTNGPHLGIANRCGHSLQGGADASAKGAMTRGQWWPGIGGPRPVAIHQIRGQDGRLWTSWMAWQVFRQGTSMDELARMIGCALDYAEALVRYEMRARCDGLCS
jgi:hypothetical protein